MDSSSQPKSIRFQLLLSVNLVLVVLVAFFLVLDYQAEFAARLSDKHVALQEEAQTMTHAIERLHHHGLDSVQGYIDEVCGQMREAHSPGHHIVAIVDGETLQAIAHHRASPEIVRAMQQAAETPNYRAPFDEQELVVGSVGTADVTVYVSEYLVNLRRALYSEYSYRLAAILGLGLLAAVIVDLTLLHVAIKPIHRLVAVVRRIGGGELGVQTGLFRSAEHADLGRAINEMSRRLETVEQQRQRAMNRARSIQRHLLPKEFDVPGAQIVAYYQPADDIAGDYYDVVRLPDDSWLICVADVTGHGVPAALGATMLKTFLLHAAEHHTAPSDVLTFINERYTAIALPGDFASMVVVRWDPKDSTLESASAGHPPAVLMTRTEQHELRSGGLLIGVDQTTLFDTDRLTVAPGDRLLLISDGASEAHNPEGAMFGRSRLAQLFAEYQKQSLQETLERIVAALTDHQADQPPADDVTLVALEFLPLSRAV